MLKTTVGDLLGLPEKDFREVTKEDLPTLANLRESYIALVLRVTKGKKTYAAKVLGVNRRTLYRRDYTNETNPVTPETTIGVN